jgi:YfiH family protein
MDMGWKEKDGLRYVVFENLEQSQKVNHCFTSRLGGVSQGVYSGLNLSFTRGEDRALVEKNYHILCDALGFQYDSFVLSHQTHTTNIRVVTEKDRGMGLSKASEIKDTDALITNVKGIQLTVFGADCVPVFLLDTQKDAIGMVHAGWRGTANGIVKKTVEKMQEVYGTEPKDILAGIGPSIGQCCFQVDDPVVSLFQENLDFAHEVIQNDPAEAGKYKIDLWKTNQKLLMQAGVPYENIEISKICTMCHTDLFYSHRVMGDARGNMAGIMVLK